MNRYRIIVEQAGYPISKMIVQCIPRDGNTYIATNRGVTENVVLIEVPRWDDDFVLNHYAVLQDEINQAFKTHQPRICNEKESWSGRKCANYCAVSEYCKRMEKQGDIWVPGSSIPGGGKYELAKAA